MKICQLCAVDFTLKFFLLPLIDGMHHRGWQVVSVCSDGPYVPEMRENGYRIETCTISRSMNPFLAMRSLVALVRLFRRERFDVLHVHTPIAALIGRIAASVVGIPLVVYTAHGFYFHEGMPRWKRSLFVALERFGGLMTDLLFSQSSEDAESAVRERIVASPRVLAIGNGVAPDRFSPEMYGNGTISRREFGIPDDAYVIGCIGRQVKEKGIAEFLSAAVRVHAGNPNVWFLLIGERLQSDHASSIDAELQAARAFLGPRLVTPGLRKDIPECLATMDLFCLPSWREGMPRTIIEAMMMAKPVLATDIRGSREEVVIEGTGVLVPVRSPEALADAMVRFVRDPVWGRKLGEEGRRRALAVYDEQKVIKLQLDRIQQEASSRGLC